MKRSLYMLTLAVAMLVSPAFASSCHSLTPSTTVCEFSDGAATVTSLVGDTYTATDYTPTEWAKARIGYEAATQAVIAELQRQAAEYRTIGLDPKGKCEAAGGNWKATRFKKCQMPKSGR